MATEKPKFTESFGSYVIPGETIRCEVDGFECIATVYHDDDASPPWSREDGHGPVSEWTSRTKEPGERILSTDRGSHRFYNFAEACRIAKRDGWGTPDAAGLSSKQRAVKAVEQDFAALAAWCNDEWHYSGVAVRVWREDVPLTGEYEHACWGIERNYPGSNNDYLATVANELLPDALAAAREKLAKLATI